MRILLEGEELPEEEQEQQSVVQEIGKFFIYCYFTLFNLFFSCPHLSYWTPFVVGPILPVYFIAMVLFP